MSSIVQHANAITGSPSDTLLYLFLTPTATETHLCYGGGVVFQNFLCWGINRKDPKVLVFKSIHNAKDIHLKSMRITDKI